MTDEARGRPTERFQPELAREWNYYVYPGGQQRVVALQPPPRDIRVLREVLAIASPILRRDGDRIIVATENCRAEYRIDVEDEASLGCSLVAATYEHHTLPPRDAHRQHEIEEYLHESD